MRAVAAEAGTTTRAVHSLFGSKEGLLIDALAESAFDFVADNIAALDVTGDPVDDLVAVGVPVFRSLTLDHPALSRKRAFWAASRSRRRRWSTTRCWKVSPMPSCAVACYRTFPLAPRSTPGGTRYYRDRGLQRILVVRRCGALRLTLARIWSARRCSSP